MDDKTPSALSQYLMPLAVLLSGALIAGAVLYTGVTGSAGQNSGEESSEKKPTTDSVASITEADHVRGSRAAKVLIVEYSDFECPFCKMFHNTLNAIMTKYESGGQVAWVFRQSPLEQLHPIKAHAAAVASECANELGGNEAFWNFTDRYFELTLTNNRTDIDTIIPQIAREIGLDEALFGVCRKGGKHDEHIASDLANAVATGGRGTPWSVIVAPNGKTFSVNGAQPQAAVEHIIELALKEK